LTSNNIAFYYLGRRFYLHTINCRFHGRVCVEVTRVASADTVMGQMTKFVMSSHFKWVSNYYSIAESQKEVVNAKHLSAANVGSTCGRLHDICTVGDVASGNY
jgi:hypothetical protein